MKAILKSSAWVILISFTFWHCAGNLVRVPENEEIVVKKLNLPSIETLVLDMPAKVIVTTGAAQTVEIEAPISLHDLFNQQVVNGSWEVDLTKSVTNFSNVTVHLTTPSVKTLKNLSTGNINYTQTTTTPRTAQLTLLTDGTGTIDAVVNTDLLTVTNKSIGKIKLAGTAQKVVLDNSSMGNYDAFNLEAETYQLTASSSSKSNVKVTKTLDATISGTGNVYYKGRPTITKNLSGKGTLIDAN